MSEFDIGFELFTLLLGLAMAEVLAGFVRVFKLRSRIRHGRGGGRRGATPPPRARAWPSSPPRVPIRRVRASA
ncbi:hypothetical protein K3181_01315 [Qipengyuania sp. YG27]|uniref:Uncharacterized protein n=1 Tax=Qipengyuania mesophila TaxID=2867246 RepID=A0ABS7JR55_9SPHN|nr:hypothetical protein [Qipengyuania mesophila]MBX7500079.1 hypothetical protein [Qipengyuania mesophila]